MTVLKAKFVKIKVVKKSRGVLAIPIAKLKFHVANLTLVNVENALLIKIVLPVRSVSPSLVKQSLDVSLLAHKANSALPLKNALQSGNLVKRIASANREKPALMLGRVKFVYFAVIQQKISPKMMNIIQIA